MYIKKYDYRHHPEYFHAFNYLKLRNEVIEDIRSKSYVVLKTFMKIWLFYDEYPYYKSQEVWIERVLNSVNEIPVTLPRKKLMGRKLFYKSLINNCGLSEEWIESSYKFYEMKYPELTTRKYCETNLAEKFSKAYENFLNNFIDELYEASRTHSQLCGIEISILIDDLIKLEEGHDSNCSIS